MDKKAVPSSDNPTKKTSSKFNPKGKSLLPAPSQEAFLSPNRKHTARTAPALLLPSEETSPLENNPFGSSSDEEHEDETALISDKSSSAEVRDNSSRSHKQSKEPSITPPSDIFTELENLESELKQFGTPSFSPVTAAQVAAAASEGKERNKAKKKAIREEMGIPLSLVMLGKSSDSSPAALGSNITRKDSLASESIDQDKTDDLAANTPSVLQDKMPATSGAAPSDPSHATTRSPTIVAFSDSSSRKTPHNINVTGSTLPSILRNFSALSTSY